MKTTEKAKTRPAKQDFIYSFRAKETTFYHFSHKKHENSRKLPSTTAKAITARRNMISYIDFMMMMT